MWLFITADEPWRCVSRDTVFRMACQNCSHSGIRGGGCRGPKRKEQAVNSVTSVSLSGVRGHEEDRQWQGNGFRLPAAAGVSDPAGRGARQDALLWEGGNNWCGGSKTPPSGGTETICYWSKDRHCGHIHSHNRFVRAGLLLGFCDF